jgi:transposase
MSQKPLEMNRIKQVQQLAADGVSKKEIKRRTGISLKTIRKYLRKLAACDPDSDAPRSDKELAALVYDNDRAPVGEDKKAFLLQHFAYAKKELPKTGVTRQLLWLEYREQQPAGYSYGHYCELLTHYLQQQDPAFHWEYTPGEFIQADFAGKKLFYVDPSTGEAISCDVFVAVLPASGYTFCYAVKSQRTEDFLRCINELLKYVGGVSRTILCDNMATAVKKADRYEPVFTELCNHLSQHYHTTFSATRAASPRDKGMVEKVVNIVYTHIYAPMRHQPATSLEALNSRIRQLLDQLNTKPYKGAAQSRHDLFIRLEQHLLKPLPPQPFYLKKCKRVTVQRNYAIRLPDNRHYYTVPYEYVGKPVLVYYNSQTVEVYHQYELIAFHARRSTEPRFNRMAAHMPPHHAHMVAVQGWTVEELLERAVRVGPYTRQAASRILNSSIYPEQNFKACHAMLLLQHKYGQQRLEATCERIASIERPTLKMIRTILSTGQDKQPLLIQIEDPIPRHANIRGAMHYR